MMALAAPAMRLVSFGETAAEGSELLAAAVAGLALGLLPYSAFLLLARGCYALGDSRTPGLVSVGSAAAGVAVMVAGALTLDGAAARVRAGPRPLARLPPRAWSCSASGWPGGPGPSLRPAALGRMLAVGAVVGGAGGRRAGRCWATTRAALADPAVVAGLGLLGAGAVLAAYRLLGVPARAHHPRAGAPRAARVGAEVVASRARRPARALGPEAAGRWPPWPGAGCRRGAARPGRRPGRPGPRGVAAGSRLGRRAGRRPAPPRRVRRRGRGRRHGHPHRPAQRPHPPTPTSPSAPAPGPSRRSSTPPSPSTPTRPTAACPPPTSSSGGSATSPPDRLPRHRRRRSTPTTTRPSGPRSASWATAWPPRASTGRWSPTPTPPRASSARTLRPTGAYARGAATDADGLRRRRPRRHGRPGPARRRPRRRLRPAPRPRPGPRRLRRGLGRGRRAGRAGRGVGPQPGRRLRRPGRRRASAARCATRRSPTPTPCSATCSSGSTPTTTP